MAANDKPDYNLVRGALGEAVLAHLRELVERGEITPGQQRVLNELERLIASEAAGASLEEDIAACEELARRVDAGYGSEMDRRAVELYRYVLERARLREAGSES